MKKLIWLTEGDLHRIVENTVKQFIKEESYLSHKDGKFYKNHDEALAYAKQIRQKKHDDMVNRIYNQRRKEYDNWANSNDTSTWDADNAFRSEPDYDQIEGEVYNKLGY